MYPGCPFEREVLGLEIVQLVLSELVPVPVDSSNSTAQRENALAKVRFSVSVFQKYHEYWGIFAVSGRFLPRQFTSACFPTCSGILPN